MNLSESLALSQAETAAAGGRLVILVTGSTPMVIEFVSIGMK